MAAGGGGRRFSLLANLIQSCLVETQGPRVQHRLGSAFFLSSSTQHGGVLSGSNSLGRNFGTDLSGIGIRSPGIPAGRKFDAVPRLGGAHVQHASTHQTPEAAFRDRVVSGEGQEQETKTHKEVRKAHEEEGEEKLDEKTLTLRAALRHVPKMGWTEVAIAAGAQDVGLSQAFAGAFPQKEAALVEFFMDQCTQALVEELESRQDELGKLVVHDRIATIIWVRLEMQIPYLQKWAQALSIQANPMNLPTTIKQRALLLDEIWHTAGDQSTDMDWYTKRAILAGVYTTTELYMLTDTSTGFKDTRSFLERRIKDALDCRKTVHEVGFLAQSVGAGLQNAVNSLLNKNRPPSGFGIR